MSKLAAFTTRVFRAARSSVWRTRLLLGAFTVTCFSMFLALSFPYDTLKERLSAEAALQGLYLRLGSLGPAFLGVTATGVEVSRRVDASSAKAPEPLRLDSLTLRPSFFPLGVGFSARLLGGSVSGAFGGTSELKAQVSFKDLDLGGASFQALTGVQASGKVQGDVDVRMPQQSSGPDFGKAQGTLTVKGEGMGILGGTLVLPLYGTPTPVDLPRASFGDLDIDVRLENGTGTLQRLAATGGDLQLDGTGSVRLDRQLPLSALNIVLKLKADPDFQKRLGLLGSGLTLLPADPSQPGWRTAKVSGLLDRPLFGPGR
jgi:type II secretion system protein N